MGGLKTNRKLPPHRLTSSVKIVCVMATLTAETESMLMMNFPPGMKCNVKTITI